MALLWSKGLSLFLPSSNISEGQGMTIIFSIIYIDRVPMEMGKQNSRTFLGLFSFFKDSISFQFCIKGRENALFSARKRLND